jgi:hypothetical protein
MSYHNELSPFEGANLLPLIISKALHIPSFQENPTFPVQIGSYAIYSILFKNKKPWRLLEWMPGHMKLDVMSFATCVASVCKKGVYDEVSGSLSRIRFRCGIQAIKEKSVDGLRVHTWFLGKFPPRSRFRTWINQTNRIWSRPSESLPRSSTMLY